MDSKVIIMLILLLFAIIVGYLVANGQIDITSMFNRVVKQKALENTQEIYEIVQPPVHSYWDFYWNGEYYWTYIVIKSNVQLESAPVQTSFPLIEPPEIVQQGQDEDGWYYYRVVLKTKKVNEVAESFSVLGSRPQTVTVYPEIVDVSGKEEVEITSVLIKDQVVLPAILLPAMSMPLFNELSKAMAVYVQNTGDDFVYQNLDVTVDGQAYPVLGVYIDGEEVKPGDVIKSGDIVGVVLDINGHKPVDFNNKIVTVDFNNGQLKDEKKINVEVAGSEQTTIEPQLQYVLHMIFSLKKASKGSNFLIHNNIDNVYVLTQYYTQDSHSRYIPVVFGNNRVVLIQEIIYSLWRLSGISITTPPHTITKIETDSKIYYDMFTYKYGGVIRIIYDKQTQKFTAKELFAWYGDGNKMSDVFFRDVDEDNNYYYVIVTANGNELGSYSIFLLIIDKNTLSIAKVYKFNTSVSNVDSSYTSSPLYYKYPVVVDVTSSDIRIYIRDNSVNNRLAEFVINKKTHVTTYKVYNIYVKTFYRIGDKLYVVLMNKEYASLSLKTMYIVSLNENKDKIIKMTEKSSYSSGVVELLPADTNLEYPALFTSYNPHIIIYPQSNKFTVCELKNNVGSTVIGDYTVLSNYIIKPKLSYNTVMSLDIYVYNVPSLLMLKDALHEQVYNCYDINSYDTSKYKIEYIDKTELQFEVIHEKSGQLSDFAVDYTQEYLNHAGIPQVNLVDIDIKDVTQYVNINILQP